MDSKRTKELHQLASPTFVSFARFVVKDSSLLTSLAMLRHKPCGPQRFCWRKTTDFQLIVYYPEQIRGTSVQWAADSGRKPVRAMSKPLCIQHRPTVPVSLDNFGARARQPVLDRRYCKLRTVQATVGWLQLPFCSGSGKENLRR